MKKVESNYLFVIVLFVASMLCSCANRTFSPQGSLDFALEQVLRAASHHTDSLAFPRYIAPGAEYWSTTDVNGWTSGYWPGILWYMYEYSGDEGLKNDAHRFTMPLQEAKNWHNKYHDLGLIAFCSFGNGYRLTQNAVYKSILLETADSLATLFNPNVGTILSWPWAWQRGWPHNTIIDNLMNLELLFWASKNGGDQRLYDIAVSHALTTLRDHVRDDYSTYHVVVYDSLTGGVEQKITHQGYSDDSMWARGQAWGIYGFTMAYRESGLPEFLDAAQNLTRVYIDRLPDDFVPYWDFDAPGIPDEYRDASSAAIVASALLELSTLVKTSRERRYYKNMAIKMLQSLSENYLSDGSDFAVLWHSLGHFNRGTEIDVPIIYADYYFIEALLRARKLL